MPPHLRRFALLQVMWLSVWFNAVACGITCLLCRQLSSWWDVHCFLFVQS